jgi:hypothetical protein
MRFFRLIPLVLLLLVQAAVVRAEVSVQAAVDKQEVSVGETFTLQVQVEGSDEPGQPDVSSLTDFTVEPRGGQQNNSESVSIINGQMSRVSHHGYVFSYGLTPKKEGRLTIPALTVTVDKQAYRTQPISILAKKPEETNDFKLRMSLDKTRVYVGEPVTLTVVWYIGKDVNGFTYNLPILSDPRFSIGEGQEAKSGPARGNQVRIPTPGGDILAEKSTGGLDGVNYLTVSFSRRLIAKEAGQLTLPQTTVSCQVLGGYHRGGRDPFSDFFADDIFGRARQSMQTVVVPSNEPTLEVLPLPEQGRPADFNGLVGSYSLVVSAQPTKVKVGDPITLTIQVAGPAVSEVTFPSLQSELGTADFKVPVEMAPGEGTGVLKTFTQTVRARHAGVKAIPSLRLRYFDPASGRYQRATSKPVPLDVSGARTITAEDAEGGEPTSPARKDLTTAKGGINFNYEGPELLSRQAPVGTVALTPLWYALLLAPPALFLLFLTATLIVRQGRKDPQGRAARNSYRRLTKALDGVGICADTVAGYQALGLAMREYLGAKLRRNPAALTYADVEPLLARAGSSADTLSHLRQVMDQCEAYEYAGPSNGAGDLARLVLQARQVATELEGSAKVSIS